ncbi:pentatricopeptide repeat-containing protein At5g27460 isoform X1 [Lathyrus oleraceus]|uniref:Pentatricopeptide repeat-containing protein At5g27460 n=2 Tax=Pisum sativum TaxID=3888 RepID=A0A9D4WPN4_PEA|nr:pentatricopeptide repeat-containing protein At5g27460 isoform X1 [Pisum sativum]XP_050885189.1 pentatricopeptide repeat-containing protein At5g27460 isoform X1 [Pisum sativum]XP_050885190.1 pentatricopeptide repeat-containing protein At5g27460 isoform X1 [Pisum sativum]XP_050885191.1 pentatricopeptide repeat-containing protein At5g27460 isoform X1 [Pisum sativum]XP_050885192.1 pentatricopeptide repeat-containing protein At5g27460 isoform X1 [Pisum sativum]XP_050885193.1 pentatricopeptide re
MANHALNAGIRRSISFVLSARNLWIQAESRASAFSEKQNLKSLIAGFKPSSRSPLLLLQNWIDQGNKLSPSELRCISRTLIKSKRYNHALEVLKWMENQKQFRPNPADHAMKVELIIKNYGLMEAEEYFMSIRDSAGKKAAYLPLLRGYVRDREISKAETFMEKLYEMGLVVNPHPYNEMMKLYLATCEYRKVPLVIQQMKRNKVPCNVLSYNLWMNACDEGKGYGVAAVETVFRAMQNDENVEVGWSSLATLANAYMKAGQSEKAILVLKNAEEKLSTCDRLGYFFIITLYASLKQKEGVLRLWEASKAVGGRINCANYICILTCLVKLGDIAQAKRIFNEWESNCQKYDIRVSNVLLGAYVRNGAIEEAESLHLHTLQKGGYPNYKTWEILIEGYVKRQKMDEAIIAMKRALAMLKDCHWRPPQGLVLAIAEYLEKCGNFEYANEYIRDIHNLGLGSLSLYKVLLRMHLSAKKPPQHILKMINEDKVEMDSETFSILKAFTGLVA